MSGKQCITHLSEGPPRARTLTEITNQTWGRRTQQWSSSYPMSFSLLCVWLGLLLDSIPTRLFLFFFFPLLLINITPLYHHHYFCVRRVPLSMHKSCRKIISSKWVKHGKGKNVDIFRKRKKTMRNLTVQKMSKFQFFRDFRKLVKKKIWGKFGSNYFFIRKIKFCEI